jgi:HAD superfamily hydrolase (TIGR01509 family)
VAGRHGDIGVDLLDSRMTSGVLLLRPVSAVVVDFTGVLTVGGERRRPGGALVREVLRDRFRVAVPHDFVARYNERFWSYWSTGTAQAIPQLLSDVAQATDVKLPDLDEVVSAVLDAAGDHPVDVKAAAALRHLHARDITCLLVANSPRPGWQRRLTLERAGLGFVNAMLSSSAGSAKPDPAFYEAAARVLDVPAAEILWVGDDPEADVLAPLRAGMQALLVDEHLPEGRATRVPPGLAIPHLAHLPRRLGTFLDYRTGCAGAGVCGHV